MKIFAANFKMNKTQEETKEYFEKFDANQKDCRMMFALPFTSLVAAKKHPKNVEIGVQNVHFAANGAYTGEISVAMAKEAGATFSIIAHSERRKYFGETDATAAKRAEAAVDAELDVIFCIGETLAAREKGVTNNVLSYQLYAGLGGVKNLDRVIVAYEPIWAIGTGRSATAEEIAAAHAHIKKYLRKRFGRELPVLYGGSVNDKNAGEICYLPNVDGVLVGGASLDVEKMKGIIVNGK